MIVFINHNIVTVCHNLSQQLLVALKVTMSSHDLLDTFTLIFWYCTSLTVCVHIIRQITPAHVILYFYHSMYAAGSKLVTVLQIICKLVDK